MGGEYKKKKIQTLVLYTPYESQSLSFSFLFFFITIFFFLTKTY